MHLKIIAGLSFLCLLGVYPLVRTVLIPLLKSQVRSQGEAVTLGEDPFRLEVIEGDETVYSGDPVVDEATWRQQILQDATDGMAYYQLANALFRQGKSEAAEAAYRSAIEYDPTNAIAHKTLGTLLYLDSRYQASIEAYRNAIRLLPNYAETYQLLGEVLQYSGQYADAVSVLAKATKLSPHNNALYHALGESLLSQASDETSDTLTSQRLLDDASVAFRASIRLDPDERNASRRSLARLLSAQNRVEDAIAIYPDTYFDAGNTAVLFKRYSEAEQAYRDAIQLNPSFISAYSRLGDVLYQQGKFAEAERAYREAIRLFPLSSQQLYEHSESGIYAMLSQSLRAQGKLAEAEVAAAHHTASVM